jgi:PAS domain S-box-containing protein
MIFEYVTYPDGQNRFLSVTDACSAILNIPSEQLLANPLTFQKIIHEEDSASYLEANRDNGADFYWQGRILVKGAVRWIEIRATQETLVDGSVLRSGLMQDVTKQKSTSRSEARYLSLIERLPIGVVIHRHGKLVYANAHAHQILGGNKELDLLGIDVMNFVHPEFHPRIMRRMKELGELLPTPMMEQRYIRLDGSVIDVETMSSPYMYQGEACVQVIFRDITERKQTEERIRKNETMLAQLFQNLPMAVVLLNNKGKVEEINKGFEEMFGYSLEELQGKSVNDFIVPEDLVSEGVDLNNLISTNRVVSLETIRKNKAGKLINVILYGMPVLLDEQTVSIYGVYVDFTERKRIEEELKIRNTELDNFVYKVSHDLRAPLSSILGLVHLAKLPGNTDNPMDYIEIIGNKVMHLDHFIGDVLSHSKNLKVEVTTSEVDLKKIITQTFADLHYLQGVEFMHQHISVEGARFFSDPWRMSEIFRNLISNAIKYRRTDIDQSEINIHVRISNLSAEICFTDNGIGIAEDKLLKIFDMFYRATEQSDGSGIGLYIVKNAVEKLGGKISVASQVNQGTRFNIVLPNRNTGGSHIISNNIISNT